jgi:hypothetical protein
MDHRPCRQQRHVHLAQAPAQDHCRSAARLGVIHLDDLPPIGVIRFQHPSGLPVLTMALGPASVETGAADLDAMGGGPDGLGHRWWTLRSESLEILPSGTWRVMANLTARGTAGLVELRLEVDPKASARDVKHLPGRPKTDWLVLRGRGLLDRRAFGIGKRAWIFDPRIQLDLALHATRVEPAPAPSGRDEPGRRAPRATRTAGSGRGGPRPSASAPRPDRLIRKFTASGQAPAPGVA